MRPVDLTGRPLGICKVATRYRVNPCPTPPPFFHPFFLLSTSFPPRPGQVSTLRRQFLPRKPPLQPATSWIATPTRGRMAKVVAGPPASSPPQEPRKTYCFALETSSINLAWTLNLILDQDRTIRSSLVAGRRMEGYQSFKVVRKKQL